VAAAVAATAAASECVALQQPTLVVFLCKRELLQRPMMLW